MLNYLGVKASRLRFGGGAISSEPMREFLILVLCVAKSLSRTIFKVIEKKFEDLESLALLALRRCEIIVDTMVDALLNYCRLKSEQSN